MSVESLIECDPVWQGGGASHSDTVVLSMCNLGRNLSDFPFPSVCGAEERESIEERMRGVFDKLGLLATGQYFSLTSLKPAEVQLLAERQLITLGMTRPRRGQGVYVSDDQCLAILVNDEDHCCIRVLAAGLALQETFARASALDDRLNGMLGFAFSKTFGFLTRNLGHTGTGMKLSLLMHLPACVHDGVLHEVGVLHEFGVMAGQQELVFSGVGTGVPERRPANVQESEERATVHSQALYNSMNGFVSRGLLETEGDLFQLRNGSTLGHTEEELIFRLKQCAGEIIRKEMALRDRLRERYADVLEDRVERARALATHALLIPFDESFTLLSSLRLGVTLGLISDRTVADLNGSLIHCQGAHLARQLQPGAETVDELSLKRLRARQFKQLFTPAQG